MSKLFIVGTPIGNLKDITLRALETLKLVDYIACEDTRVSQKLLNYYQISNKKLITYNNFNEINSTKGIISLIKQGKKVALISDAGMPVVSDPGFKLIKEAKNKNIIVELVPGISALTCIFTLSSLNSTFSFHGFFPATENKMITSLNALNTGQHIFFISPHKLEKSLQIINKVLANKAQIFLAKEITKLNEKYYFGNAQQVLEQLDKNYKGEFSIAINITKPKREKINKYKKRL